MYKNEKNKHSSLIFLKEANDELEIVKQDLLNKNKVINQLANTDKLTQLYNRLKIDSIFISEIERAIRYNTTFSIILLDIDLFKEVNDAYGHEMGDYALIEIANLLKNNIRTIDKVGRFGGEEFLIICPETSAQETQVLSEKLRVSIEDHEFRKIGKRTCSFGVSEFRPTDISQSEILKRADTALYEAKNNGRNMVCVF